MTAIENLLTQVLQLPSTDRASIARELLLSLETEPFDDDYESAWQQELVARIKKLDDGSATTVDWRDAHAEIRSKLRENRS